MLTMMIGSIVLLVHGFSLWTKPCYFIDNICFVIISFLWVFVIVLFWDLIKYH
jgi:hypothetical protein